MLSYYLALALASMRRMFREHLFGTEPKPDEHGLIRMDDRELSEAIQTLSFGPAMT